MIELPTESEPVLELWKQIPSFPDYDVSNTGRIRSRRPLNNTNDIPPVPRILTNQLCENGYVGVRLCVSGKKHWKLVHRLILEAFVGPCPKGMESLHGNGVRSDNRLDNLKWGSKRSNMLDRDRHGTTASGERNGRSRLTNDQVREIKAALSAGVTRAALAARFGVGWTTIDNIAAGRRWQHV